ncbi:S1 RNA-binding domain-containing protein [Oscillospiraceae bacterium MB08-C2-2]|nr:S1 RNA-binding domain-containing protein [Oscillospiraceae bacterium MB08-C2-2]
MEYLENILEQESDFPEQTEPSLEDLMREGDMPNEQEYTEQEEASEKPSKKRRKKAEEKQGQEEPVEELSVLDIGDAETSDTEEELYDEAVSSAEQEPGTVKRRRRTRQVELLDGEGRVIQDHRPIDGQRELSLLSAAQNGRRILSATLDGFEAEEGTMPRAVFYVGPVKVMIPFNEMGFRSGEEEPDHIDARLRIGAMLGAKIYYMVRGVDMENRVVGASRRDAMNLRRRTVLNAKSSNGEYRVREGVRCLAQLLYVDRFVARVEIYGMEVYLHIGDISNLWGNDIREVLHIGEERPVEIVEVIRDDETGEAVSITASMRLAEEAPQVGLQTQNTYTGTISGFSDTAFYVKAAGIPQEIRCPIKSNYVGELMEMNDVVKFYVRAIYDGVPTGAILKILKKVNNRTWY